jgi:hypothetical protein
LTVLIFKADFYHCSSNIVTLEVFNSNQYVLILIFPCRTPTCEDPVPGSLGPVGRSHDVLPHQLRDGPQGALPQAAHRPPSHHLQSPHALQASFYIKELRNDVWLVFIPVLLATWAWKYIFWSKAYFREEFIVGVSL